MKRTKIVCTLGPATSSPQVIKELIRAGMDVARINLSHGAHEEHRERIRLVRRIAGEMQKEIGILADLQGPKIRTGELPEPMELREGMRLSLRWAGVKTPPGLPPPTAQAVAADLPTASRRRTSAGPPTSRTSCTAS